MSPGNRFPGVVLVGFMGSGKSTVGKVLARRVGAEFVDVDAWIERAAGRSIREIFADEGEPAFRVREKAALAKALSVRGRVVATGGGSYMDEENRALMKSYGPVVYLETGADSLLRRLARSGDRPLLRGGDRETVVRELLERRIPEYRKADITVSTDDRTVEEVAGQVAVLLEGREGEGR